MNLRLLNRVGPFLALITGMVALGGTAAPPAPAEGSSSGQLSPSERAMKMTDVPSIWVRLGVDLTAQNLASYIEAPLRPAVSFLLAAHVPTYWASANQNDVSGIRSFFNDRNSYSQLGLEWEGLSPENQKALLELLPQKVNHRGIGGHYTEGRGQIVGASIVDGVRRNPTTGLYAVWESLPGRPKCVRLFLPTRPTDSVGEIADAWLKLAGNFRAQEPYRFQKPTRDAMSESLKEVEENRSRFRDFVVCLRRGFGGL